MYVWINLWVFKNFSKFNLFYVSSPINICLFNIIISIYLT
jgi:hypothetical protein